MNKLIVVIILGCSLTVADCANPFRCFRPKKEQSEEVAPQTVQPQRPSKEFDVQGLNEYLVANVPAKDREVNLAHLKTNLDSLEGGLGKAAEMVLELANEHVECNNRLLYGMAGLERDGLDFMYHKRIDDIVRPDWRPALRACDELIAGSYKQADKRLAKFMLLFRPTSMYESASIYSTRLSAESIILKLNMVDIEDGDNFYNTKIDELTGTTKVTADANKLVLAVDKYLLEPCKKIVDGQEMLNNMLALRLAWTKEIYRDATIADDQFRVGSEFGNMDWRKRACKHLLNMSPAAKDELANHL